MSASYNRTILMGNLTGDPQLKELGGDKTLALFSIAVNDNYKKDAPPLFMDCEYWNPTKVLDYMSKGTSMLVEGRLKMHEYEKDGIRQRKIRLTVQNVQLVGSPKASSAKKESELMDDFAGRF